MTRTLALFLLILALAAVATAARKVTAPVPDIIRTEDLEVLNAAGRPVADLSYDDQGGYFGLCGSAPMLNVANTPQGLAAFGFADSAGNNRLWLRVESTGAPSLRLQDAPESLRFLADIDASGRAETFVCSADHPKSMVSLYAASAAYSMFSLDKEGWNDFAALVMKPSKKGILTFDGGSTEWNPD